MDSKCDLNKCLKCDQRILWFLLRHLSRYDADSIFKLNTTNDHCDHCGSMLDESGAIKEIWIGLHIPHLLKDGEQILKCGVVCAQCGGREV